MAFETVGGMGFGASLSHEVVYGSAIGTTVALAQEFYLREKVDIPMATSFLSKTTTTPPFLMKVFKNFGSPSAFIGIASGAVAVAVGAYSALKGRLIRSRLAVSAILTYGLTSLIFGILSGIFPTSAWSNAVAQDPANPVGYNPGKVTIRPIARPAITSAQPIAIGGTY